MLFFVLEYILLWIANGMRTVKKRIFGFSTISTIYYVVFFVITQNIEVDPKIHRILHAIAVCLISIRSFASNFVTIFSPQLN